MPPGLHYTLGPHAATPTSGFRVSRIRDSKSLALGNPEYRGSDTPDFMPPVHARTNGLDQVRKYPFAI
jgi:hypothetical protein